MYSLKAMLGNDGCRGVVRSTGGMLQVFRQRGVADLFRLVDTDPGFLKGAAVADIVVGRGAALLFVKGGVAEVYARTISTGALQVLKDAGVKVEYGELVSRIINRSGTGPCPVEQLTAGTGSPDEAFLLIRDFIEKQKQKYK